MHGPTARTLLAAVALLAVGGCAPEPPKVQGLDPATGPLDGGIPLRITGRHFGHGAQVLVGGEPLVITSRSGSVAITGTLPRGRTAGPTDLKVVSRGRSNRLPGAFTYVLESDRPFVSSLAPAQGPVAGGTAVTIAGVQFDPAGVGVLLDTRPASGVTVVSAQEVRATVPAGAGPGPVDVVVTNTASGKSSTLARGYTYSAALALASVDPARGARAGGTRITVTGTGLAAGATLRVGGAAATELRGLDSTRLVALTPASSVAATVDLTLTTPDGQESTLAAAFTYGEQFLFASHPAAGRVASFRVAPATGVLGLPSTLATGGAQPTRMAFDGERLFVGQDGGSSVAVLGVNSTSGVLSVAAGSPVALSQPGPYELALLGSRLCVSCGGATHVAVLEAAPGGAFQVADLRLNHGLRPGRLAVQGGRLYVLNPDAGSVSAYAVDPISGRLSPLAGSPYATGGGAASRPARLAFDDTGSRVYVGLEGTRELAVLSVDAAGVLTRVPGTPVPVAAAPAELMVDANRLAVVLAGGGLAVYEVPSTGVPVVVSSASFTGSGAQVDRAADRYLVAWDDGGSRVAVHDRDPATGALTPRGTATVLGGAGEPRLRFHHGKVLVSRRDGASISVLDLDGTTGLLDASSVPGSPFSSTLSPPLAEILLSP
ncbi:MAG: IPT/TIG domain-containing protein [Planctomycetes bacterium]|nr:IPT/TIG domain-containing protein [Planctomycetota bacterium]